MSAHITVPGCDAPNPPSVYVREFVDGEPVYECRCLVCSNCGHHTGNTSQGHYWAYCKATKTMRAFHFCCPDACELQTAGDAS